MPGYTNWYVTVLVEVAGKERAISGPSRSQQADAEQDLDQVREFLGSGTWINLPWLSANPQSVVAAYLDSKSFGFG